MKAIIPCAGEGVRMRPLTLTKPKQLIELRGRPILEHIINNLPDEVDEVILVVGYLGDKITDYFGSNFSGKKIHYINQMEKLGTAHALWLARKLLRDERFLMMYGDDIIDKESINKLLKHNLAVLVKEVPDPSRFGVIVADEKGRILSLVEKPKRPLSNLASTGVKILDSRIFNYPADRHSNGEYYITSSLAKLATEHNVYVERADIWLSVASPEDLLRVEKEYEDNFVG
ncbi:nucleotidyltransferase family protein [Candidatus Giovannonibacteria bacterium]|nr:nucleotidyltransferase family protein [Candidatus Giovannonibacteria bacterium]